jgi:ABC-type transport system involved in multi-copper enzyme maturation permease subunit
MLHALQSELFRLRRRPQTWIMPILATVFVGAFYAIIFLVYQFGSITDRPDMVNAARVDNIFSNGMQMFGFFGGILIVIVASSLIGSEFGWNTLRPLVARAASRSSLLSAKWVVVALYTVVLVVIGVLASLALAAIASLLMGIDVSLPSALWDDYALGTLRWIAASLPYAVIAFAVALLTRSNAAGIAIGIGLSFVEPLIFGLLGLISDSFQNVQEYGIAWNVQQLVTLPTIRNSQMEPVAASQVWQSTGILAVYIAIFVVASYIVFNRRDITSG